MASFKCRDIGFNDEFEVKSENREELIKVIGVHAKESHHIVDLTPDLKGKIERAIKK